MFDNQVIILEDPRLRAATAENVANILQRSYWWPYLASPLYRPITTLSYLLNYAILGNATSPAGYHAINLILHLANVSLVLAVARRLTQRFWLAFVVASLWGVHPLLTEAVTNIVGRADLLAATGTLGALYCHLRLRKQDSAAGWLAGVAAFATLAVFSKESGAAVVGVLVLYDLAVLSRRPLLSSMFLSWAAAAAPVLLLLYQRAAVAEGATTAAFSFVDNPILDAGVAQGRLTALAVAGRYLWLLLWPVQLSADYSFPQIPLTSGTAVEWAAWMTVAVAVAVTLTLLVKSRVAFFALASSFVVFVPASNLLFASGTIMAERLMYLPAAGVIGVLVAGLFALSDDLPWGRALLPVIATLVIAAAGRTYMRNADWRDELTLWSRTVQTAPRSFKAHNAYAEALYQADAAHTRLDEAIDEKERSLALLGEAPDRAAAIKPYFQTAVFHFERGERSAGAGDAARARADFTRARELVEQYLALVPGARRLANPPTGKDESDAHLLLSTLSLRLSGGTQALASARRSREMQPFEAVAYQGEAAALLAENQPDAAVVTLLTGFIVTGTPELRSTVIQLYSAGLDTERCATRPGPAGIVLDLSCGIVQRHLCAASSAAVSIFEQANRSDLARQARDNAVTQFKCN